MKIIYAAVLTFLLLFTGSAGLMAQEIEDTLSVVLEPINVEATHSSITIDRASISVTTLQRSMSDMTARRASSLDELTFSLPGVWVSNRENHALGERMSVRGMGWRSPFGVRGIQIILDGIPLTVADGQTILNMVDPAMVQSLELLRGPSATFWGNSSGGVLYMRTQPPADAPNFMFRSYMGSFNTMKHEGRWHDRIGGVNWNAYGSYYDTDGFREHNSARLYRGGISAGFDITEDSNLEARLSYAGMPNAQHPGSLTLENAMNDPDSAYPDFAENNARKNFQQVMSSLTYRHDFETGLLTLSGHGTHRDLENPLPFGFISVDRLAGGTRATYDIDTLPFQLQVGGEMKWQRDDRGQRNTLPGGQPGDDVTINQLDRVNNQALFGQALFDIRSLSLNFGLRADRMVYSVDDYIENEEGARTFATINPSAGINYNLGNARLFVNFSTSFDAPTTTEFKNRPGGGTGFNPNLDPERTAGLETGIRGYYPGLNLEYDVALFGLRVTNLIIPFEEEDGGPTLYRNEGDTRHTGIEIHLRSRPADGVLLELMYTWIDATFGEGDFEGNKLPGVAPHRIGSKLSFNLGNHVISSDVEWVGEYHADSQNTAVNDSYFLLNSRYMFSGLNFDGWKLQPFASVYNILDKRYNTSVSINAFGGRFYEPGSSRNVQAGLSLQF
ncbi:MAG: TonB-dependent receptor [Balneolaceae bacterium]